MEGGLNFGCTPNFPFKKTTFFNMMGLDRSAFYNHKILRSIAERNGNNDNEIEAERRHFVPNVFLTVFVRSEIFRF